MRRCSHKVPKQKSKKHKFTFIEKIRQTFSNLRNQLKNNDQHHTKIIKNAVQLHFLDCFTNLFVPLPMKIVLLKQ